MIDSKDNPVPINVDEYHSNNDLSTEQKSALLIIRLLANLHRM